MKEKNSIFFKTYYILMVIFAIIGLIDASFAYFNETFGDVLIWAFIVSLFAIAVFILSIIAIVKFRKYRFSKITLFIPIYHIVIQSLLFVLGMVLGAIGVIQGVPFEDVAIPSWFAAAGVISSTFELIFAGYILNRFR